MKAMWRMIILTVSMMWSAAVLNAQSQDEWKVISALVGEDVENMNEHEVERLQALLVRPVRINTATLTRLVDSGLFTRYQAASLIDYRNRSGAVMSFMELATIDGFGQEFTDRIRPFLCLDMPASGAGERVRSEALLRTTFKNKDGKLRYSYDSRYDVEMGERIGAAIGISRSLDARRARPDIMSGGFQCQVRTRIGVVEWIEHQFLEFSFCLYETFIRPHIVIIPDWKICIYRTGG